MSPSIKNLFVGIFILSAIGVLISLIMFLKPTVGDGKQTVYVRFSDIGSLNIGTRVLFAGRPVGEVVALEEIKDAREQPTDELGRVYFYQLTLHIDSSVKIYNTDEISIQRSGLMGERSISITPKAPPKGVTPRLISDQPIYANSVDTLENALLDFGDLSATMEEAFRYVSLWVKDHGEEVAQTVKMVGAAFNALNQTITTVNEIDLVQEIQKSVCAFGSALTAIKEGVDELQEGKTFRNAASVMQNLKGASHSLEIACEDVALGKGTLGRLVTDDTLYLQLSAIMTKANNLMNDVNHYGILFHLNKQWQRTRLKKINELNALCTPDNFQTYFQGEVDEINAAMTRISMLIERADENPNRSAILSDPAFKRDFQELLRKAGELSDNLKLYNLQFAQAAGDSNE